MKIVRTVEYIFTNEDICNLIQEHLINYHLTHITHADIRFAFDNNQVYAEITISKDEEA